MEADTTIDTEFVVELRLAPVRRSVRPARAVVASVGVDLGFDVDELDDLRVAVQEALGIVLSADPGPIDVRVTGRTRDVTVTMRADVTGAVAPSTVARQLLDVLVAEHRIEAVDGSVRISLRSHEAGA